MGTLATVIEGVRLIQVSLYYDKKVNHLTQEPITRSPYMCCTRSRLEVSPCQKLKKNNGGVFFDHMPFLILISEDPPRDESDERNSLKKERTTERTVDHRTTVDPDVMEYIYSSKYKANFKCFLEDKGISHFEWEPGAVLAYFECHEQKRDECLKALYFFLSSVQKSDIPVEEVFWDCVKAKLPEIRSKLGNTNRPIIKIHKTEERKLQIVSYISDIGQHIKSLNEELDKVKKEAANACETFSFALIIIRKTHFFFLKRLTLKLNICSQSAKMWT